MTNPACYKDRLDEIFSGLNKTLPAQIWVSYPESGDGTLLACECIGVNGKNTPVQFHSLMMDKCMEVDSAIYQLLASINEDDWLFVLTEALRRVEHLGGSSKFQKPNSKEVPNSKSQIPRKFQNPKTKFQGRSNFRK